MKRILLLLLPIALAVSTQAQQTSTRSGDLQFIQNQGQWDEPSLFRVGLFGGTLFLEPNAFTYTFSNIGDLAHYHHEDPTVSPENFILKQHAYRVQFNHADPFVRVSGESRRKNYYNYFLGDDEARWKGHVPSYYGVRYSNMYPGIDMVVYSKSTSLKYDFEIAAGANPGLIEMQYDGLSDIQVTDGNLILTTNVNTIVEQSPVAWQYIQGVQVFVKCVYTLKGNTIQFAFPDGYATDAALIIDPATLIFASYTGSSADNWGYTATYDDDGNLYGGGIAFDDGYPVTLGAFSETYTPGGPFSADISISKFNESGSDLIYSTYLGGSSEDLPYSLIVDENNELIVFGSTGSANYPTVTGCYDGTFNGGSSILIDGVLDFSSGSDAVITKFSIDGSSLIGSTYFGGTSNDALNTGVLLYNYGDHARGEVNIDEDGNIYIAGVTRSPNLPVTGGVFQPTIAGEQDGFLTKFNPDLSDVIWSTFVGGSADDGAYSIKEMLHNTFIVCGGTASTNLNTTPGALHEDYNGGTTDGFLMVISEDATSIIASTYIGTNQYDQTFLTEVDEENNIYITGQTRGAYPVIGTVYNNPGSAQYITKLDSALTTISLSTVFGNGVNKVNITQTAFLVDNCDKVYVCGWGGSVNLGVNPDAGNVTGMPLTPDAFQPTTDGNEFYLIVFGEDLATLEYATYFGGEFNIEHVDGGTSRFDKSGVVYQAVCAGCGGSDNFPTTEGAYSNTNNSSNCNLGVFKFALAAPPTNASFIPDPTSGCYPVEVEFTNLSENAISYDWDFGDGSNSITENPTHTYSEPGVYTVTLIANADGLCTFNDTTTATITVFDYPTAGYTYGPNPASVFSPVFFTDASSDAVSWLWEFGDGFTSTEENPYHLYAETGTYYVCQTVTNADGCIDKLCDSVIIYSISILEVPNAFSPNNDGVNDVFIPLNYGLLNYEFRIYNRWGELIFETSDTTKGWDGYYNGVEQELDVYVYVVSGNGEDGVHYSKQGNFTLVR